jgi:hypothetical protein
VWDGTKEWEEGNMKAKEGWEDWNKKEDGVGE